MKVFVVSDGRVDQDDEHDIDNPFDMNPPSHHNTPPNNHNNIVPDIDRHYVRSPALYDPSPIKTKKNYPKEKNNHKGSSSILLTEGSRPNTKNSERSSIESDEDLLAADALAVAEAEEEVARADSLHEQDDNSIGKSLLDSKNKLTKES